MPHDRCSRSVHLAVNFERDDRRVTEVGGSSMVDTGNLLALYICGWIVAVLAIYAVCLLLSDSRAPATHPLQLAICGGAVWPMLVVAVVELSLVAACAKLHSNSRPNAASSPQP